MVRAYKVKGRKRSRREENYDRDEEDVPETPAPEATEADEAKAEEEEEEEEEEEQGGGDEEEAAPELEGIPVAPSELKSKKPNVTFVLERASLEVAKVGKSYQILNSDDHANFLRRNNKSPGDYRPDIVHQALLSILDSTINKAGRIRAIYVRTDKGVLFEVNPHVRLPRTYKRFSGVMLQLLQKLSISAVGKREKLLRVVKNPVTQYLPVNSRKIGFSHSSDKVVKMRDYVRAVDEDTDLVFMVGSMAHGKIDKELADDYISVSGYPLSAACCIFKICEALADKWDIL